MKRLHKDSSPTKYKSGKWTWDEKSDGIQFHEYSDLENANERYIDTNGYKFLRTLNEEEESVFRQVFMRPETTFDADTVVINDVRDLVLFLMPKKFLTLKFIKFMHLPAIHRLLHSLIIYFEYFLRMVEFILIRRDELSGNLAQVQSEQTNEMKRIWSSHLAQCRMLVARNYSPIIMGERDMAEFYHTKPIVNISSKIKDKFLHEQFLAVTTQIVWITMHRRAYFVIEMEMNRLFRSEHFLMNRTQYLKFTPVEQCLIYGRNNKIFNYRNQSSPMIQELRHIADEDMPILWIGERRYRGNDARIAKLELEYIVPGPQLHMIDVVHGILGHPKKLYNTILDLDWTEVRYSNFSETNDPYHLVRQPHLNIPSIKEMHLRQMSKNLEHFYKLYRIYEPISEDGLKNWTIRESLIEYYRSGQIINNIYMRCEQNLAYHEKRENVSMIVTDFLGVIARLRKKYAHTEEPGTTVRQSGNQFTKKGFDYYFKELVKKK